MSVRYKATRVRVSPSVPLVLAAFLWLSSPRFLLSVLLAALCHEWGHCRMVRHWGGHVAELTISALGAEMRIAEPGLSYGREMLAVAAGPTVNLALAAVLGALGRWAPAFYLFAGTQAVLGVFNLIPVGTLDGGTLLWLAVAWCSDPFLADRIRSVVNAVAALALIAAAGVLWRRGGSPFLLLSAALLLWRELYERRTAYSP